MNLVTAHSVPTRAVPTDGGALEALRSRIAGEVITAESPAFDGARNATFLTVDRRPLAIVRPASDFDIAAAIDVARDRGLPLAVRSGGHSLGTFSMVDGGIVVDLSSMHRVIVDPETRTARVEAGASSADLAGPAAGHGLALSAGDTPTVGMGGLTTGGGIGFMVRKHGLAIDNLLSARIVTAAGEIVTASETEHPDLFWAVRGGGGNVGIVTEFTFRLAEMPEILGGMLVLPASREAIRGYLELSVAAPDELTTIANLMLAPEAPFVPPDRVGTPVLLILAAWSGDLEAGERALAPLRALAEPVADLVSSMPYPAIYDFTEPEEDVERAASVRMMFADDLSDQAIDAMLAAVAQGPPGVSFAQLRGLGGAMARVAPEATAFAHRERRYFVALIHVWYDLAEDAAPHEVWTRSLWEVIRDEGTGVYVNFLGREGAERLREAYPGATYDRLAAVKAIWDPDNLFRLNQNIPPRG
jgi:FAD/FMN-containing dehydrogenase